MIKYDNIKKLFKARLMPSDTSKSQISCEAPEAPTVEGLRMPGALRKPTGDEVLRTAPRASPPSLEPLMSKKNEVELKHPRAQSTTLPPPNPEEFPPPARAAHARRRHFLLFLSFLVCVIAPTAIAGGYLYAIAADRYASHIGFSVRKEEVGSAIELLGGITELSGSSSSDTDILYEFLQSQQIVRTINEKMDLFAIYHQPNDPIFSLGSDRRIEALHAYWSRMSTVFYDSASGLIEVRVLAFTPEDAQELARILFEESSAMINRLSTIAREDATRYAEEELTRSVGRLKTARQAIQSFQIRTQIVDPKADLQGQMGLLNTLNTQLSSAQIDLELLLDNSAETDPRVQQVQRKIAAIKKLIKQERSGFSDGQAGTEAFSTLLAEFQALRVDQEFAEKSYLSSQAAYDAAVAEAQRQSRYLATHIEPTLAETPEYPRRFTLLVAVLTALSVGWAIAAMIFYSLRDRR